MASLITAKLNESTEKSIDNLLTFQEQILFGPVLLERYFVNPGFVL